MRRPARTCRATIYSWCVADAASLRSSSNGCFVIGRVKIRRCHAWGDGLLETRYLLGPIVCQGNEEDIWSGADQTHGEATLVLNVIDTSMNTRGHGHEVLERHNDEDVGDIDATVLWRGLDRLRWWSLTHWVPVVGCFVLPGAWPRRALE